jgi:hypothetical protein
MIPLDSPRWNDIQAYAGAASLVPQQIMEFQKRPDSNSFDRLWDTITGEGDIRITPAFLASFPHIVAVLMGLDPVVRVEFCCHLGWAVALTGLRGAPSPPVDVADSFAAALKEFRKLLPDTMLAASDQTQLRYLLAAMAASSHDYRIALGLIHADDALACPMCREFLRCRACGASLETWPDLFVDAR